MCAALAEAEITRFNTPQSIIRSVADEHRLSSERMQTVQFDLVPDMCGEAYELRQPEYQALVEIDQQSRADREERLMTDATAGYLDRVTHPHLTNEQREVILVLTSFYCENGAGRRSPIQGLVQYVLAGPDSFTRGQLLDNGLDVHGPAWSSSSEIRQAIELLPRDESGVRLDVRPMPVRTLGTSWEELATSYCRVTGQLPW